MTSLASSGCRPCLVGNIFNMAGGFWLRGLGFWGSEFRAVMGKKMEFIALPIHRLYYPLDNIRSIIFWDFVLLLLFEGRGACYKCEALVGRLKEYGVIFNGAVKAIQG